MVGWLIPCPNMLVYRVCHRPWIHAQAEAVLICIISIVEVTVAVGSHNRSFYFWSFLNLLHIVVIIERSDVPQFEIEFGRRIAKFQTRVQSLQLV